MILKLMIMEMIFTSNNTTTFDEYNRSMATMAEDQGVSYNGGQWQKGELRRELREGIITEDNGRLSAQHETQQTLPPPPCRIGLAYYRHSIDHWTSIDTALVWLR